MKQTRLLNYRSIQFDLISRAWKNKTIWLGISVMNRNAILHFFVCCFAACLLFCRFTVMNAIWKLLAYDKHNGCIYSTFLFTCNLFRDIIHAHRTHRLIIFFCLDGPEARVQKSYKQLWAEETQVRANCLESIWFCITRKCEPAIKFTLDWLNWFELSKAQPLANCACIVIEICIDSTVITQTKLCICGSKMQINRNPIDTQTNKSRTKTW